MIGTLLLTTNMVVGQRRPISLEQLKELDSPTLAKGSDELVFNMLTYPLDSISEDGGLVFGSFIMENRSSKSIVITRATTDCGCLKVTYTTTTIKAGGKAKVNFTYNPKGYPGRLNRKILVYTNLSSSRPSAKLMVKGHIEPSSDMSGRFPYAKGAALLKSESVTFTLKATRQVERILAYNNSDRAVHISALQKQLPAGLSLSTEPSTVAAKKEFDIVIAFDPKVWQGDANGYKLILDGVHETPRNSIIEIKFK